MGKIIERCLELTFLFSSVGMLEKFSKPDEKTVRTVFRKNGISRDACIIISILDAMRYGRQKW